MTHIKRIAAEIQNETREIKVLANNAKIVVETSVGSALLLREPIRECARLAGRASIAAMVRFGLLLLGLVLAFAGNVVQAQPCAGTTVSGTVVTGADSVTCNGGTTVIDFSGNAEVTVLEASGSGPVVVNNDGSIRGDTFDVSGLTEGYTINNNAGATWYLPLLGTVETHDLGRGEINNAGTIRIARRYMLSAPGSSFAGTGDSVLALPASILDGNGRPHCAASVGSTGCLDLTGGETSGQTTILVGISGGNPNNPFADPIDMPISPGVVVVDVKGGASDASHFVLDPASENYEENSKYGGVIDTGGLFDYALLYNPGAQQHMLASVPQNEGLEYATFAQQALSIWHTSSDTVAGRQADLRDQAVGGGWVRIVGEHTSRDAAPTLTTHGNNFTYGLSYSLDTGGAIAGFDLLSGGDHAFGVHAGLLSASTDYDDSSTTDKTKGVTAGVYGGLWNAKGLSLDAAVNVNMLELGHSVSTGLEDSDSTIMTLGWRMEAGWRLALSESLYVQPLATVAYAQADIDDLYLRDYDLSFEDSESLRSAMGARLGGDTNLNDSARIGYWVVARAWEEHRDQSHVVYQVDQGSDLAIYDDFSGSFEEIGFGASFSTADELLNVFASGSMKSGDDTDSYAVSLGTRLRW